MAELSTIARPYAQGLWKALADRGDTAQAAEIEQSLFALSSAVSEPQVAELVSDPKVTDDQMYDLLAGSIGEEAPSELKGLLRTVIENGRLCALPEIAAQFRALVVSVLCPRSPRSSVRLKTNPKVSLTPTSSPPTPSPRRTSTSLSKRSARSSPE